MDKKRLDIWLAEHHPEHSRSQFQTLIKNGRVFVNGRVEKKRYFVAISDRVEFSTPLRESRALPLAENIPLKILFEDRDVLLIDKPAGLVVHPGAGNWTGTFANALLHHCSSLTAGDPERPGIVHRLDRQTTGLLLAAKNEFSHRKLSEQFANRRIEKFYLAITCQRPIHMRADFPIGRDPRNRKRMAISPLGKEAMTQFRVVQSAENFHLIEAKPITGRTHQIRLHLSALKAPILGDLLYGGKALKQLSIKDPFLHAWKLSFAHPRSGEKMHFSAPLPKVYQSLLRHLKFENLPSNFFAREI